MNNNKEKNVFEETLHQQEDKTEPDSEENENRQEESEASENNQREKESEEKAEDNDIPKHIEKEELQTRFLRLAADFQNYKRRIEKEKSDIYAFANEKLMVELLDVIDNFDRAVSADCTDKAMLEGMNMILKQLKGVLEKNGLEEINAEGEVFDPEFHHAVLMEDVDSHKSGEITGILKKGYLLNKKVIRPAMVKVAQ